MEAPQYKPKKIKESGTEPDRMKDAENSDEESLDSDDESVPDLECNLCKKEFLTIKLYEEHLKGKRHRKMLTKLKLMQEIGKSEPSNSEGNVDIPTNLDDEKTCEVCSKTFSGYIPYSTHLSSTVHSRNLKKQKMKDELKDMPEVIDEGDTKDESDEDRIKPYARCSTCEILVYDPASYQKHMQGSSHRKKMKEINAIEKLRKEVPKNAEGSDDKEELFSTCDLCNKSFSGPVPFKMHLESPVHKKELKRVKAEEGLKDFFNKDPETQKLICKKCNKAFTDPFALKIHLDSNSHEKQNAKEKVFSFVSSNPEIVAVKTIQNLSLDEENDGSYPIGSYSFVCKFCHVSFSGPENAQAHIKSKKHIQVKTERAARKALKSNGLKDKGKSNVTNGSNSVASSANINETSLGTATGISTTQQSNKKTPDISDDFELL